MGQDFQTSLHPTRHAQPSLVLVNHILLPRRVHDPDSIMSELLPPRLCCELTFIEKCMLRALLNSHSTHEMGTRCYCLRFTDRKMWLREVK